MQGIGKILLIEHADQLYKPACFPGIAHWACSKHFRLPRLGFATTIDYKFRILLITVFVKRKNT